MVAQVKPSSKNSPAVRTGKNTDNGPAEKYAKRGVGTPGDELPAESKMSGKDYMNEMSISTGTTNVGKYAPTKTEGVAQRGHGAATKGFTSRGPLA